MFTKRLTLAMCVLAAAVLLEAGVAIWAMQVAERQVQRGRVASDIHLAFVELSVSKQRLRTWVSQAQMDADAPLALREQWLADMHKTLRRLDDLSQQALANDPGAAAAMEHARRHDARVVLAAAMQGLQQAVREVQPLAPETDAREAWDALSRTFDMSNGRDLRGLLADNMALEAAAVVRERAAADDTLRWTRWLWLSVAATLCLGAMGLALYFVRALRHPLNDLRTSAQAFQAGQLDHRVPPQGDHEFAAVALSMNAMAQQLGGHRDREAQARQQLEALVQARTGELQDALLALQQVDQRRRQLFADISHELRTPTTAIRGEAEISLRGRDKPPEDYKASLQRIVDGSRQLGLVIDDLLSVARSDIETLSLQRKPMDLHQPLAEALAQARALAHERDVQVCADELPAAPMPVLGDAQRLRQLLVVVLDNAVRYSRPGGTVRLDVQAATGSNGQAQWEVRVRDEGIGIPAHELPRVFDRSFRGEQARLHRADGAGLGLAIGASLARHHGGELALESAAAGGTLARLLLPAFLPPQDDLAALPGLSQKSVP